MIKTEQINIRDPFVLADRGVYYLYGTRGTSAWGKANGFDVYTGRDLAVWEGPFECFHNDGSFWADRNYWAPEVHAWNGAYYMFASFKSDNRRRGTAILRAGTPLGPFVPWSSGPVTPADWECLDGTFYVSPEGRPYMVFCHEWVQAGDGEIHAMQLSEDLRTPAGGPRLLFRASDSVYSRPVHHSSGLTGYVTDGPFLWRADDGSLLCLWSGFSEKGYAQFVAVSDNGDIDGHFVQTDPLFLENGGHGMLFWALDGQLYLTLHSPNTHLLERPVFLPLCRHEGKAAGFAVLNG